MIKTIFISSYLDQQKTIHSLLEESKTRPDFYVMIALATFIATIGLITDSNVILIGSMLIAPILFPILSLSLAVVTSSRVALLRSLLAISKAVLMVIGISFVTAFLFLPNDSTVAESILNRINSDLFLLLFLSSLAAGFAATYSWVRQDLSATLPGVAVTATVLPPLASFGTGLVLLNTTIISDSLTIFLLNVLAIILGGVLVFSLFGFAHLQAEEEEKIEEEKVMDKIQTQAVKEENDKVLEENVDLNN